LRSGRVEIRIDANTLAALTDNIGSRRIDGGFKSVTVGFPNAAVQQNWFGFPQCVKVQ